MDHTGVIFKFRRFLKLVNYSEITVKNYFHVITRFSKWINISLYQVNSQIIFEYLGYLHNRNLSPQTINSYLNGIKKFYDYLLYEQKFPIVNPVKSSYRQFVPKPLPRFLKDLEINILLDYIKNKRDIAMFMLMLRCGLRVSEVANLTFAAIDWEKKRILVLNGKFRKDRIVFMSDDTVAALKNYIRIRPSLKVRKVFLVQKGIYKGNPISAQGIQKRMKYYAKKTGVKVCCHRLRHTMATQLLNADAMLSTVQELMGHECIISTQRYGKVSNPKVRRDYFRAMELVMAQEEV
jgi:site-specific recombinase XerD